MKHVKKRVFDLQWRGQDLGTVAVSDHLAGLPAKSTVDRFGESNVKALHAPAQPTLALRFADEMQMVVKHRVFHDAKLRVAHRRRSEHSFHDPIQAVRTQTST